ncbi:MAG: hypothetical protein ACI3ZP_03885 [Candidatus Cryptobacteroides sp.]
MYNVINRIVAYVKNLTLQDLLLFLIFLSPVILTAILMTIGEIEQRETRRRLENRPNITWLDILTPEEKHKMGLDRLEEMEQTLTTTTLRTTMAIERSYS